MYVVVKTSDKDWDIVFYGDYDSCYDYVQKQGATKEYTIIKQN